MKNKNLNYFTSRSSFLSSWRSPIPNAINQQHCSHITKTKNSSCHLLKRFSAVFTDWKTTWKRIARFFSHLFIFSHLLLKAFIKKTASFSFYFIFVDGSGTLRKKNKTNKPKKVERVNQNCLSELNFWDQKKLRCNTLPISFFTHTQMCTNTHTHAHTHWQVLLESLTVFTKAQRGFENMWVFCAYPETSCDI